MIAIRNGSASTWRSQIYTQARTHSERKIVRRFLFWEALTKKIPGENENFMHVGDSHHKLTIWYHIIGTKYIAQIRFELCVDLNSN